MPSGMTLDSLNSRFEGSYLILFLLPFGVSMVTRMHPELVDRPLVIAVPFSLPRSMRHCLRIIHATRAPVASHTDSAGRNAARLRERRFLRSDIRKNLVLMFSVTVMAF